MSAITWNHVFQTSALGVSPPSLCWRTHLGHRAVGFTTTVTMWYSFKISVFQRQHAAHVKLYRVRRISALILSDRVRVWTDFSSDPGLPVYSDSMYRPTETYAAAGQRSHQRSCQHAATQTDSLSKWERRNEQIKRAPLSGNQRKYDRDR